MPYLEPNKLVIEASKHISNGSVLDIGCGDGHDAVYLAKKGLDVSALDVSQMAIHKVINLSKIHNVQINAMLADIGQFNFDKKYNLILCDSVFHFLPTSQIHLVIKKIKDNTSPRGINAVQALNVSSKNNFSFLFKKDELKSHYNDWEIIYYEENEYSIIIARKPE